MFYGIDLYYIYLVVPAILFTLFAQIKVKSTFSKYSKVQSIRGLTGAEAARAVLSAHGVSDVSIEHISGSLTDHFDPKAMVIRLSDSVYSSTSVAAIGVAAHEAGHAVQHAENYAPMRLRSAIIPVTNIGSKLAFPLILIGLIFSFPDLAMAGVVFYGLSVVFQLVTVPVEFNASRRAMETLESSGLLYDDSEVKGAKKTLSAAAMTYVAALWTSIAYFLRLFLIVSGGRRRK